jgi:Xaa-Pro dipeptidase
LTYDIETSKLTLFIPPVEPDDVIWSGLPLSPTEALEKYNVDKVFTTAEVNDFLASYSRCHPFATLFAIDGQRPAEISWPESPRGNLSRLKRVIENVRVVKDEYEISLIAKANEISGKAHMAAVDQVKTASNERELHGIFIATCIALGCREQAYPAIVASGTNAATLHYVKNDESLKNQLNVLLDAGGEYNCYSSDITRTFPISGTFSRESRSIYEIVDEMQCSCFEMLKAGVMWDDVHMNAHRIAIKGLKTVGILKGDDQEIFEKRVSVAFFPHGLGHYLGMDTHDTGGNADYNDPDIMFRYLRKRGRLPENSVITVEPGVRDFDFFLLFSPHLSITFFELTYPFGIEA